MSANGLTAAGTAPGKILMTADPIGGVWTYALELVRAMAPHGTEFALAIMGGAVSPAQREELAALPNATWFEHHGRLEWMDDPWLDMDRSGDWLLELAADFAPDVVHLNGFCHGALPWDTPVLIVAHSCVLSWWAAVKTEDAPPQYDEYQARVSAGLEGADCLVAPTAALLGALDHIYGSLTPRRVIHNARDPRLFSPGNKQPCILSAGRFWDEAKNISALDRVAPAVHWPIYVAGDGQHPDGWHVELAGARPLGQLTPAQMAARLGTSAIYALPARYEPFGLSALEAGLCGCALVLGDIPSLREVWGDAALFVAPDDECALARTLNSLIADQAGQTDLGRRARSRALEYSPQTMAQKYLAAYGFCLTAQPAREAAAA